MDIGDGHPRRHVSCSDLSAANNCCALVTKAIWIEIPRTSSGVFVMLTTFAAPPWIFDDRATHGVRVLSRQTSRRTEPGPRAGGFYRRD